MQRWCVADVMSREVVTVTPMTGYKEIADLLVGRRLSAVPVINASIQVLGVVSEADLIQRLEYADRLPRHPLATRRLPGDGRRSAGDTAGDLMTSPAVTISAAASVARAARLMSSARVKRLPVVDRDGRLEGIVSRRDLLRLYSRTDEQVRDSVEEILRSLAVDAAPVRVDVRGGVVTLRGKVDRHTTAAILAGVVEATPGVVEIVDEMHYDVQDLGRV